MTQWFSDMIERLASGSAKLYRLARGERWALSHYTAVVATLGCAFTVATYIRRAHRWSEEDSAKIATSFTTFFDDPTIPNGQLCFSNYTPRRLTLEEITPSENVEWLAAAVVPPAGGQYVSGGHSQVLKISRTINPSTTSETMHCVAFFLEPLNHRHEKSVKVAIAARFTSPEDGTFFVTRIARNYR
jgi:hypothetical protein